MALIVVLAALAFLMFAAYRGYSVIIMAPVAALGAVLLTSPSSVAPMFSGTFMVAMVGFLKNYFPVFLLGAIFGKLIELSGFSKAIVAAVIKWIGADQAILVIVVVCALLTYGGVSLFVAVFAVYPFAAELFRQNEIPKRLIPGVIALGAFSFTMDALPGTPQIQNIIPTTFFGTTTWAAPALGIVSSIFILALGITYLNWRRRSCVAAGEGYASGTLLNEPEPVDRAHLPNPILAISPLILIGVVNFVLTRMIPVWYGDASTVMMPGMKEPLITPISGVVGIWAVEGALVAGILFILVTAWSTIAHKVAEGSKQAVSGAMLAGINTASEYGFGAVIATLPGFLLVKEALVAIPNPLVNAAVSVSTLAGITGSASGGMSIALAALGEHFVKSATEAGIPMEVLHRIVAMASGGMDTLPQNGAVITVLAVTGLTHRQSYPDIFAITIIKTMAVFFAIGLYYTTGLV
ncbi:GntP family permease [Xanthobacter sp. TB0139]|uniref:GntP family permease n=1 Tax=Xanthobacter sp. TB0139 TaxID=3459178 RepID=UPI0040395F52